MSYYFILLLDLVSRDLVWIHVDTDQYHSFKELTDNSFMKVTKGLKNNLVFFILLINMVNFHLSIWIVKCLKNEIESKGWT